MDIINMTMHFKNCVWVLTVHSTAASIKATLSLSICFPECLELQQGHFRQAHVLTCLLGAPQLIRGHAARMALHRQRPTRAKLKPL